MGRLASVRQTLSRVPFFSSLYGRVFVIFWLTLLLVLAAVIWAQRGDPRSLHPVPAAEQARISAQINQLVNIATTRDIPIATLVARHNQRRGHRHSRAANTLYWVPKSARIDDLPTELRRFMAQTNETEQPMQRLVRRAMLAGPFSVSTDNAQGNLYHARRWQPRLPFVLKILETPQHLLLVTMLVSTPLLLWLAYTLTRPARRFEAASRRVANGDLVPDPALECGPREFSEAGKGFNHMVTALNQMVTGQQQLVSDISHELRSPLTRLQMARALAERELGHSDSLARIEREAGQLEALIAELLTLSKLQAQGQLERASVSADVLWQSVVDDASFEANQQGKSITITPWPSVTLSVNSRLACSALENVLRNAIRYAHLGIDITTFIDDTMLVIQVADDGPGVPESMLTDIFRPFYRVSAARERQSGGTGLGLAITAQAVQQHGGQVLAHNRPQGGLVVTLRWPVH